MPQAEARIAFRHRAEPNRYCVGAFGFAVATAYIPGIISAATVPRWMAIALAALLIRGTSKFTIAHAVGLAFIGYCALSLTWTPAILDSLGEMMRLVLLVVVFSLGMRLKSLHTVALGFGLGLWINCGVTLVQEFYAPGFLPSATPHSGMFVNLAFSAEISSVVVVWLMAEGLYWVTPPFVLIVMLDNSRTAFAALFVAGFYWVWRQDRILALSCAMIAASVLVLLSTIGGKWFSASERLWIYYETLRGLTLFGHGIGSFMYEFPVFNTHFDTLNSRVEWAHSDVLQMVFELGVGACLFFAFIGLCLKSATVAERYVLVAVVTEIALDFPLHLPATAFVAALLSGHACRGCLGIRTCFRHRRDLLRRFLRHRERPPGGTGRQARWPVLSFRLPVSSSLYLPEAKGRGDLRDAHGGRPK